jgi:hypothetical protein
MLYWGEEFNDFTVGELAREALALINKASDNS